MWAVKRNVGVIGGQIETPKDKIIAEFSFFRGPNRIIWYSYSPSPDLLLKSRYDDTFIFFIVDKNGNRYLNMRCSIDYIQWNDEMQCMEIRLVPVMYQWANTEWNIENHLSIRGMSTIGDLIPKLFEDKYKNNIAVSPKYSNMKIYNDVSMKGVPIDYICKLAEDVGAELYISDEHLSFGGVISRDKDEINKLTDIDPFCNTIAVIKKGNTDYMMFSTSKAVGYPGRLIRIQGNDSRIIYTRYYYSQDKGMQCTVWAVDINTKVTEKMLSLLLKETDKQALSNRMRLSRQYGTFVYQNTDDVNIETDYEKRVKVRTASRDMNSMNIVGEADSTIVKGAPYAGETVGEQFPNNPSSYGVAVTQEGDRAAAAEVAQLWNNVSPTRTSMDDYRLTLPDGGTLYYSAANKEWILAAKDKVTIGTQANLESTTIPNPPTNYIQIDEGNDKIIIKTKDLEETYTGTYEVSATSGMTLSVGANSVEITAGGIVVTGPSVSLGSSGALPLALGTHQHMFEHMHAHPMGPTGPVLPTNMTIVTANLCTKAKGE